MPKRIPATTFVEITAQGPVVRLGPWAVKPKEKEALGAMWNAKRKMLHVVRLPPGDWSFVRCIVHGKNCPTTKEFARGYLLRSIAYQVARGVDAFEEFPSLQAAKQALKPLKFVSLGRTTSWKGERLSFYLLTLPKKRR